MLIETLDDSAMSAMSAMSSNPGSSASGDHCTSLVSTLQDCILEAGGRQFRAHRKVLSDASNFLKKLFENEPRSIHPVIDLKGVTANDLKLLLEFIYRRNFSFEPKQLPSLMATAKYLQIDCFAQKTPSHVSQQANTFDKSAMLPTTGSMCSLAFGDPRKSLVSTMQDCTIEAGGRQFRAHKHVLSAASDYLKNVVNSVHRNIYPVVNLKGISANDLGSMLEYIYCGRASFEPQRLPKLLEVAQFLQIRGLAQQKRTPANTNDTQPMPSNDTQQIPATESLQPQQRRHAQMQTGQLLVECDVCLRRFANVSGLNIHKRVHTKTRFECEMCSKTFSKKKTYTNHMEMHSKRSETRFECEMCLRTFSEELAYSNHMEKHLKRSGAKPVYKCEHCPKTYIYHHSFTIHKRDKHNCPQNTENQPKLECDICSMTFTVRKHYTHHMRVHKLRNDVRPTHKCRQCPKVYVSRKSLSNHISLKHTDHMPLWHNIELANGHDNANDSKLTQSLAIASTPQSDDEDIDEFNGFPSSALIR